MMRIAQLTSICFNRRIRRDVVRYVDGALDPISFERVRRHLESCASCRAEAECLQFASTMVSRLVLPDAPPAGMPQWSLSSPITVTPSRRFPLWKILVPAAAAALVAAITITLIQRRPVPPAEPQWRVMRLSGAPQINAAPIGKSAQLRIGEWLETGEDARALLALTGVSHIEVESNTRLTLVESRNGEQRLSLQRGQLFAAIAAPPRLFFIDTPAGTAIDLGCAYTLQVDTAGATLLHVTGGAVALASGNRETVVPAGALCQSRPVIGAGTPYFESASQRLKDALVEFDFNIAGAQAIAIILKEAQRMDALTLWNLLQRVEAATRERVFEKLVALVPLPAEATREGILQLDRRMLDTWEAKIEEAIYRTTEKVAPVAPGRLKLTGTMESARSAQRATLLDDGRVLITGGFSTQPDKRSQASAEIYDPATGEFSAAASMTIRRAIHTATRLADGRVLITGGMTDQPSEDSAVASAEIYDPATGKFEMTGSMTVARVAHEATRLADGRVLITGGMNKGGFLDSAEIYDPATGRFTLTASMHRARADHTATRLADGRVLLAGGYPFGKPSASAALSAEIYDPQTGAFTLTGPMIGNRFKHSAVLLPNGKVLLVGGNFKDDGSYYRQLNFNQAELYDPASGTFQAVGELNLPRFKIRESAVLLGNGKVLIAGGGWGVEVYDPATNRFSTLSYGITVGRYYSTATLLQDGRVLIAGGFGSSRDNLFDFANASAWIYEPE